MDADPCESGSTALLFSVQYTKKSFSYKSPLCPQLQTLPAPLSAVEGTPILMGYNVAMVLLHAWELSVERFDTETIKGPVPVFFAEEPVGTTEIVDANSTNIRIGLEELMKRCRKFNFSYFHQEQKKSCKTKRIAKANPRG